MASDVDICNLALSHIGNRARVASINPPDQTVEALHCSTFYPIARDVALEGSSHWRFAKTRAALALSASTLVSTNDEWAFAYNLPASFIKAIKVAPPGALQDHPGEDYTIETDELGDDVLLTNVENAVLHYIFRETVTGRYSPLFVLALSHMLASLIAGPIIRGKNGDAISKAQRALFDYYITQAATSQLNQQQVDKQYKDHQAPWISDR